MAFDGIVTQAITHELKNDLIGGKIDKIHQPDKNTILLGIYSNSIHYALNICIDAHNCRINLTTNSKENPLVFQCEAIDNNNYVKPLTIGTYVQY